MAGTWRIRLPTVAATLVGAWLAGASATLGATPPTTAEIERATARFLESRDRSATGEHARGPKPAPESIFPESRVVSFYGAPQLSKTIVGRKSPEAAGRKLLQQAAAYEGTEQRPVVPSFDLIGVIATSNRGPDGKYRSRQDPAVIDAYLAQAREIGARLMLDVQPGRANVLAELRALRPWLAQPDVDVSIDPEWSVGRRGVPGRSPGSIKAGKLNRVSTWMQELIDLEGLPPKVLVIHQFERGGIRRRKRLAGREDVEVTINFDGIGGRSTKKAGYARFATRRLFNGFSLFYRLDRGLMRPRGVLRLEPEPDFVLYQ